MTGALGTDCVNSEFIVKVKVFGDRIGVLWDIEKQFLVCRRKGALEEHESEIHEVGGYR